MSDNIALYKKVFSSFRNDNFQQNSCMSEIFSNQLEKNTKMLSFIQLLYIRTCIDTT